MTQDELLKMENYVLALAYAPVKGGHPGQPLRGKTVLQKVLFHFRKALQEVGGGGVGEIPHFYGPFDEQAEVVAEQLEASGYMKISNGEVSLTTRGLHEAKDVWEKQITQRERGLLEELKSYFSDLSIDEILAITYAKYPETAVDSIVKEELDRRGMQIAINLVRRGKIGMELGAKIAELPLDQFMRELSKHNIAVVEREVS